MDTLPMDIDLIPDFAAHDMSPVLSWGSDESSGTVAPLVYKC